VHLMRNSPDYAGWKDRRELAAAIKPIYTAAGAEAAQAELAAFEQGEWGQKFPTVVAVVTSRQTRLAATNLLWLALRNITADWTRAAHNWKAGMNQFAILYEDRVTRNHL
jgi:putative transposase